MPVMQPPTGPIEITDPNNVPDVLINGPFNIINIGGMVQVTFTNVRPDDGDLFSGKTPPRLRGTVACRLLTPAGVANQLVRTLADVLIKAAQSFESAPVEGGVSRRVSSLPEPPDRSDSPCREIPLFFGSVSSRPSTIL